MKTIRAGAKMAVQAAKCLESASLIILSKSDGSKNDADYKVLLFSRSERASFMPKSSVFPGGVRENEDESLLWATHFKNFGVKGEELNTLVLSRDPELKPQPKIFQTKEGPWLHKDISLRITAIRETFEEMGIMVCRNRDSLFNSKGFGHFREDFDRKLWQHLVHENPAEFLNLCQKLDVVPDIWSLNEWSVWLTPATFKKRFETAFYLIILDKMPKVLLEEYEAADYMWLTPKEALLLNLKGEITLPPPQRYELLRLLNFGELTELKNFATERAEKGTILILPVIRKCSDGMVSILPGDTCYPEDPDSACEAKDMGMSMSEFRATANKLHRVENDTLPNVELYQNFAPIDGHKKPASIKPLANL